MLYLSSLILFINSEKPDEIVESKNNSEPECNSDCECKKGFMCIHHQCKSRSCRMDSDCHKYGLVSYISIVIPAIWKIKIKSLLKLIILFIPLTECSVITQLVSADLDVPILNSQRNTVSVGYINTARKRMKEVSANAQGSLTFQFKMLCNQQKLCIKK